MDEEAKAFDDNNCGLAFDEDEKDSGTSVVGATGTVTISYALSPVATLTREVLNISAAVNFSSILVGKFVRRSSGGKFI